VAKAASWWLYVLECHSGALYTGVAKDVEARFEAHRSGKGAKFTRLNRPLRILGKARLATRGKALRAEYALKQLRRADKLRWCAAGLRAFVSRPLSPPSRRSPSRPAPTSRLRP
jgi:putative endonuclease